VGTKKNKKQNNNPSVDETLAKISEMVETMEQIYFKNMLWLRSYDKKLHKKLEKMANKILEDKSKEKYAVELNKEAALDIIYRKDKTFLYNCEPFIYGDDVATEVKKSKKIAFIGTGLGTHITSTLKELKPKKILVYEKNVQIFRCSLYVTDYETLSGISDIKFAIDSKFDESKYDEVVKFDKY